MTRHIKGLQVAIIVASFFCAISIASAEAGEWGQSVVRYSDREMILERGTLRIDLGPQDFGLLNSGLINNGRGLRIFDAGADVAVYHGAGASLGIIDNLEAGVLMFPILFTPEFEFGAIEGYGRYRFVEKAGVEVAAQAGLQLGTGNYGYGTGAIVGAPGPGPGFGWGSVDFATSAGLAVLLRPTQGMRIDTGVELELFLQDVDGTAGSRTELHANFDLPFALNFNITENFFLGGRTGFLFPTADLDYFSIGLGMQGGYTLARGVADITGWLTWNNLLFPAAPDGVDKFNEDGWEIGAGANLYVGIFD